MRIEPSRLRVQVQLREDSMTISTWLSLVVVSVAHHLLQGPQGRIPRIHPLLVFRKYYNLHDSRRGEVCFIPL